MCNSEQKKENNKPKEDENSNFICNLLKGAVGVFIVVILLFVGINIWGGKFFNEENTTLSNLGTIGDYFGGLINPLLGFVSFCALLYTIRIQMKSLAKQSEELELTREELKATKEELARSAKAQEQSSAIFKQQQFETTFFSLINQLNREIEQFHNDIINKAEGGQSKRNEFIEFIKDKTYTSNNTPRYLTQHPIEDMKEEFESRLEELMGEIYYFHNLIAKIPVLIKVILNLIKSFGFKGGDLDSRENFYVNVVKSNLSREALYIIAIIGYGDDSLRNLIEKYNLLEFMSFRFNPNEDPHPILRLIAYKYQDNIFRENIYLPDLIQFEQLMINEKNAREQWEKNNRRN